MAKNRLSNTTIFTILTVIFVGLFVLSTLFTSFNIYFYVVALFFAAIFILRDPEIGLYVTIILTIVFERFFTLQPIVWGEYTYKIYPLDILILLTVFSFIFHKLIKERKKLVIGKLGWLTIVFAIFSLFSAVYGIWQGGSTSLALSTFKNYALYAVFLFLVINIIDTREKFSRLVKTFLISGAALLFFIFIGWWRRAGLWIEYTPLSTFGTRLLAPSHAFYLSIITLFSLNLYAYRRKFFGDATFLIILIQMFGILSALTRHLYLAMAVAVLISLIFMASQYRKNLIKITASQIGLILIFVIIFSGTSYLIYGDVPILGNEIVKSTVARIKTLTLAPEDESSYFRIFAWQKAWDEFSKSPILGIGFGQKLTFDYFGYPTRIEVRELHNDFIAIGLQMGVVGFAFFLALNLYFLWQVLRHLKKTNENLKPHLIAILAGFILFIISANFGVYFDVNLLVIFYWIILGMGAVIIRLNAQKKIIGTKKPA